MKKTKKTEKPAGGLLTIIIVKLLAIALAAITVPSRAQVIAPNDLQAETASFVAVGQFGSNGPESFVIPVSNPVQISEIRQYLAERAAGTERRPLVPTCIVRLKRDGGNRNYSAPGAPEWGWEVAELVSVRRAMPELELYPALPEFFTKPSEIEGHLRGVVLGLPDRRISLVPFPIVMELRPQFPRADLANISNRGLVGRGSESKITGFVIDGGVPRRVVIRALGPSLAAFGVTGFLANPQIDVYKGAEIIADNDDWATGNMGSRGHAAIHPAPSPFHLIPGDPREPALELTLEPGAYTIIVNGVNGGTGIVLTEIFTL